MSRRRRSRRQYAGEREHRFSPPAYLRQGEPISRGSSEFADDFDRLFAAPAVAPIHRFPDFESDPAPFRSPWAEPVAWLEYPPPNRATIAQERRKPVLRSSPRYSLQTLLRPFFRNPEATAACVRRKERREVIFATIGGGRGTPPRKRTEESNYSCGPR